MRLRPTILLAGLGAVAGLAAVATVVSAHDRLPAKATPACTCHASRHVAVRHTAVHVRRHVSGHVWRQASGPSMSMHRYGPHMWRGEHQWSDQHGWSSEHQWSDADDGMGHDGRWFHSWDEHRWATDQFGFLTWPGKTHYLNGRPVEDGAMPPPPPPGAPEGEMQPPPPGEDWQGPQPAPGDSYIIRRF